MRYIIVKKVAQFDYYWNCRTSKWEGLMDNATAMDWQVFSELMPAMKSKHGLELSHREIR